MFKTEEETMYFEKDYPNYENILLKHRSPDFNNGKPKKYLRLSKESIANSKIMIFKPQKYNYLCLDCDKGSYCFSIRLSLSKRQKSLSRIDKTQDVGKCALYVGEFCPDCKLYSSFRLNLYQKH